MHTINKILSLVTLALGGLTACAAMLLVIPSAILAVITGTLVLLSEYFDGQGRW